MKYDPAIHHRKSIRLKDYDYTLPGGYFITLCTHDKVCVFGDVVEDEVQLSPMGVIAKRCWDEIPRHFPLAKLDEYVVMPNHIHGIIVLNDTVGAIHESPLQMTKQQRRIMLLPKIVGHYKMTSAKEINILRNSLGAHVWQRNYYEHIIRDGKDLDHIREYINENPIKWYLDENNPNRPAA